MRLITIALFLFFCGECPAQRTKIDSLKKVIASLPDDTNKVNNFNLLARQIHLIGNYDSAIVISNEAKSLGEKIGFKKGIANAYNNIGNANLMMGQYDSALKYHTTSLSIQTEIANQQGQASSHNNIGSIYFMQGNYPLALKNYLEAVKIYEQIQFNPLIKNSLAACYSNIGNIYFRESNFDEALKNYSSALKIRIEIDDKQGVGLCYGNIGNVYYSEHKYEESLKNHFASLKIKEEIGDMQGIASTYGNVGVVYYDEGKYEESLQSLFKSAKIADSLGSQEVLANAFSNIGQSYVKLHKGDSAIIYFTKSLALGKEMGSGEILKNSYNGFALADSANGNWESAFKNYQLYVLYRDSLTNDENSKKILQAQMNFDFEKKEDLAKQEQLRKDSVNRVITWTIIGISLLLLLSCFLFFNQLRLKQKNKFQSEKQKERAVAVMETQELERKRIAEDLHDSLGHLLSAAKLNLQTTTINQNEYVKNSLTLLNQASEEIRNITFDLMPGTLEEEGLIAALEELAAKVTSTGRVKVILNVHNMERFILEKQSQFNIYRIVQEAVNNILKHADAKEINIQLIGVDNHFTIMIEDDGKGFDTKEKKSGRGLKNIVTRSLWLKGNINIDSSPGHGTTITTEIPA